MSDHDVDRAGNPPEVNPDKIEIYHLRKRIAELEGERGNALAMMGKWMRHEGHVCPSCGMPDDNMQRLKERIAELEDQLFLTEKMDSTKAGLIDELEQENQRLREALQAIADDDVEEWEMAGVAITALEGRDDS